MDSPIQLKRCARDATLAQLRLWRARGAPFVVDDAETGADVTRVLSA